MPGTVIGKCFYRQLSDILMNEIFYKQFILILTDIRVKVGDHVEKGQPLVVLSAMKMEMVVQAPRAGTIKSLEITNGMKLEGEDLIVVIE